jgi:hypothetical protein
MAENTKKRVKIKIQKQIYEIILAMAENAKTRS